MAPTAKAVKDYTDIVRIGKGHTIKLVDDEIGERISLRVDRPEGTGLPLHEAQVLTYTEAQALLQLLMDAVG